MNVNKRKIAGTILILSLIIISFTPKVLAQKNTGFQRDSAILSFKPNSSVLYEYYKRNSAELSSIMSFVSKNTSKLQNGISHINVVSYVTEREVGNPAAINNASIQASVVRAQFKTRYNIPHSAITFSIDTTQNISNCVRVDVINTPVPLYSNSAIYYTESSSSAEMKQQMAKYSPTVPYTNYFMKLSRMNPNYTLGELATMPITPVEPLTPFNKQSTIANPSTAPLQNVAQYDEQKEETIIATTTKDVETLTPPAIIPELDSKPKNTGNSTNEYINPPSEAKTSYKTFAPLKQEVFGLKTNLLYWAAATPNLEMEFYIGGRVSLNIEGQYTWGWFLPEDKAYYFWNAGGEVRVWLKNNKQFNGHFFGVYGSTGQFDFKFGKTGNQGDLYSAGLTYGYTLPIKNRFNIEFSLGVGVIGYSQNNYEFINGRNISIEKFENKIYFGPTKAKVSLLWKF